VSPILDERSNTRFASNGVGHSPQVLLATLARAVLREDAVLIAVARYLAAHSPTERATLQTVDIARRLMRGGEMHQEEGASS
jgi:hypothetical protein